MRLFILQFISGILFACTSNQPKNQNPEIGRVYKIDSVSAKAISPITAPAKTVNLTHSIDVKLKIENRPFIEHQVWFPVPGFLKSINVQNGQYVKQGELLAILSHPQFLDLKIQFLEAKNEMEYQKKNFTRQGELAIEMATSLKNMEIAERTYKQAEIRYYGLNEKLKLLGINANKISPNSLNSNAYLYSQIDGIIELNQVVPGQFYNQEQAIFTIAKHVKTYYTLMIHKEEIDFSYQRPSIQVITDKIDTTKITDYLINEGISYWVIEGYFPSNLPESIKHLDGSVQVLDTYYDIPQSALILNEQVILFNKKDSKAKILKLEIIERKEHAVYCNPFIIPPEYEIVIDNTDEFYKLIW